MINLQSPTSVLAEFNDLKFKIGKWADKNFDKHFPELGLAEEVGELCHYILKREQKIRSVKEEDLVDALADATIYLLHYHYKHNILPMFAQLLNPLTDELPQVGSLIRLTGSLILNTYVYHEDLLKVSDCACILTSLWNLAEHYNLNLYVITNETWTQTVSKRNWKKHKHDGLKS